MIWFLKGEKGNMKNNETMKIKDTDSLKKIQAFLKNADIIIKDKTIKLTDPSAKTAFSMVATGGVLVALSLLPVIGPFVATPMLASTGIGLITPAVFMMKDLNKAKSLTYKNALAKQTAIVKALREEQDADKERIELLEATNKMLTQIINDLKHDLDMES